MMKHCDVVIERVLTTEIGGPGNRPVSLSADWIDEMILIGRLYVGGTMAEHMDLCAHITAEREADRLIKRVRARAACQSKKGRAS